MPLPRSFLEELKQRNDILSVMSSYVDVKTSGNTYVCSCPFHSERTPSCRIYPDGDRPHFYCYGCGAGGDVIAFIRLIERLEYMESVKFLAQRAGMAMPEDERFDDGSSKRVRMLEMNKCAARHFRDNLLSPEGRDGLEYLMERGLTESTIKRYGLGFAPDNWHDLHFYLRSQGYSDDEMAQAALVSKGNNKVYDKFRYRVMFPIIDRRGNVIAFGGRALRPDEKAKYLNSDETLVFQKRANIFSLNFAKNTKEKYFILCEGYMDVISLNQAGFDNAIATLGTAITAEQANLMKRYVQEVVISYDSDGAGQKAALKAINLLGEAGINAKVLHIPDAKDPDEYVKKFGAESFRNLVTGSETALDFEFKKLGVGIDLTTAAGKTEYLNKAVTFLAQIRGSTERTVYISEAASLSGQQPSAVRALVDDKIKALGRREARDEERQLISGVHKRDHINPEAYDYPVEEKAERGIIAFMFHSPDKLPYIEKKITADDFPTEFDRRVYKIAADCIKSGEELDLSSIGSEFSAEETGRITGICKQGDMLPYNISRLDEYINVLIKHRETKNEKSASEMTDEELLKKMEELKLKKQQRKN